MQWNAVWTVKLVHYTSLYDARSNCGTDRGDSREGHGTSGSEGNAAGGSDYEWKEHVRYFQHDMWSCHHPWYYLEAIGWVSHSLANTHSRTQCILFCHSG